MTEELIACFANCRFLKKLALFNKKNTSGKILKNKEKISLKNTLFFQKKNFTRVTLVLKIKRVKNIVKNKRYIIFNIYERWKIVVPKKALILLSMLAVACNHNHSTS